MVLTIPKIKGSSNLFIFNHIWGKTVLHAANRQAIIGKGHGSFPICKLAMSSEISNVPLSKSYNSTK